MNYRTTKLLAATDLGVSGTKEIPINVDQPISRIMLKWKITKSISYMSNYAYKDIQKIELVDGSDVLHSLDGGQNQALCIYNRKCGTMMDSQIIGANSHRTLYGIDFGRYLWDPVLALDPKRFKNLQLKVTYNEVQADTGNAANTLEVIAEVFDEKVISPIGFLMSKAHHAYTIGAADSFAYVDLPTDHPYRKILLQCYASGYHPSYVAKEVRLNEDNEKRIPFDWELNEYEKYRKGIDTPVRDEIATQIEVTDRNYYLTPTDYWAGLILQMSDPDGFSGVAYCGKGGKFTVNSANGVEANGVSHGWLPNHCYQFPFGDPMNIEDWYDVSKIGSLQLRVKAGDLAGTGVVSTILEQLRRY